MARWHSKSRIDLALHDMETTAERETSAMEMSGMYTSTASSPCLFGAAYGVDDLGPH